MQVFNRMFKQVESLSGELADANFELQETESAVARFVPFDLLRLLGRESIQDIEAGDHASREMSVLYCEIRDDASTRDRPDHRAAFEALSTLVDCLEPLVYHRDGFVTQYSGHGLLALFPRAPEDALGAAFEMVDEVERFERGGSGASASSPRFRACIGISTGQVLVGTIGGEQHFTSSVFGDVVVEAQRVAELGRSTGASLLVMASTRGRLADASGWTFRDVGRLAMQGGASSQGEAATVFEVARA